MADVEMPLTEHLEELRWRIVKAFLAVMAGFGLSYFFANEIFALLEHPLRLAAGSREVKLIGTGLAEAFFTKLKVAFIGGLFLASPAILFQIWQFVAPGLHQHEKRYAIPFVVFGTFFFVAGAVFCYKFVFEVGFAFFIDQYETIGIEPTLRISEYLTFISRLLLAFAICFQLPVFAFFLARIGMINHLTLIRPWRYAMIIIVLAAAILTPGPDVASQVLLAGPLLLLYGLSIGVAYVFGRPVSPADQEDEEPSSNRT